MPELVEVVALIVIGSVVGSALGWLLFRRRPKHPWGGLPLGLILVGAQLGTPHTSLVVDSVHVAVAAGLIIAFSAYWLLGRSTES